MLAHLRKKHYGNALVESPNGAPMFRCSAKKASWYLERDLAEIVEGSPDSSHTLVIRLTFEPKGPGRANDDYYLSFKPNHCVVCGTAEKLTRHHVVPYCYRRYFPADTARWASYDIVLLCVQHHHDYEHEATKLKEEFAQKHNAPLDGIGRERYVCIFKAESYRKALIKHYKNIPEYRRTEMLQFITETMELPGSTTLEDLKNLSFKEEANRRARPDYYHGELVVPHYDIDDFAIVWRQHFVSHLNPTYLPAHWVPDKRIYEARRYENIGPRDLKLLNDQPK